ncbi:hypothetical protein ACHAPA_011516 [Fusarium lateritium]
MSIPIEKIREELPSLKRFGPGLVGVFVGATSGIGEHTAREFVRYATAPRLYLIGRNREQAQRIEAEFALLNPSATVQFIQSDVSELRTVDKVCRQIQTQESKINLLFLSAGIFHMRGREETREGLDRKMALDFYSRLRFTENLLPQLRSATTMATTAAMTAARTLQDARDSPTLARVISVLGGGAERTIDTNDLSLKHKYTLNASTSHAVTMTTLSLERLAANPENASVAFCHTRPGMVKTNGDRELPFLIRAAITIFSTICSALTVSAQECGERHLRIVIHPKFSGGKLHLVGPRSEEVKPEKSKVLIEMREAGLMDVVGKHTNKVFRSICNKEDGNF